MTRCWEIKNCPASHYMDCEAYNSREDCWKIRNGCMCKGRDTCDQCPIYILVNKKIEYISR